MICADLSALRHKHLVLIDTVGMGSAMNAWVSRMRCSRRPVCSVC